MSPITRLVTPTEAELPAFRAALERGWSPESSRPGSNWLLLSLSIKDPAGLLAAYDDPEGRGPPIEMPDGSRVPRLPGLVRWILDGEGAFCGSIGARWRPGTVELPPYTLGHIGYTIVPWQRRRGHATRALGLMLDLIRPLGLPYVVLTTDPDNQISQRVIRAHGGELVDQFRKVPAQGGGEMLRFRIRFDPESAHETVISLRQDQSN